MPRARHDSDRGRQHQRHGVRRAARVLRDGARRAVHPARGARAPAVPNACLRHCRAGRLERGAGADRHLRPARRLHRLCRGAVCRRRRGRALRAAPARAERGAAVRALGYPVAPGVFVLASAAIVLNAFVANAGPSLAGVALILAGCRCIGTSADSPAPSAWRRAATPSAERRARRAERGPLAAAGTRLAAWLAARKAGLQPRRLRPT